MDLEWCYTCEDVDWRELADLYITTSLGNREPKALLKAFSNSMYKCFVRDSGRLVGAGRALADGSMCSYICDVAVHPDYQRRGIGKAIVSMLVEFSSGHKKIILYAYPDKESFYEHLGFKHMNAAMMIAGRRVAAAYKG